MNRSTETVIARYNNIVVVGEEQMSSCKQCKDQQYCKDCMEELNLLEETPNKGALPKVQSGLSISFKGEKLIFKGRTFNIIKIEARNPNKKITTKEGFIFYVRTINQENVLVKIKTNKPKKGRPQICDRCFDILIGEKVPQLLFEDPNW